MGTVYHSFRPLEGLQADEANNPFPQPNGIGGVSGNIFYQVYGYDDAITETAYWGFRAVGYGSGNLTVDIFWVADTATSGNVVWGAAIAAVTPDVDSGSLQSKAFATEATVTDTHLGTNARRLHKATITISSLDSLAADDEVFLRIRRLGGDASDTMVGDALLAEEITLSYSDT